MPRLLPPCSPPSQDSCVFLSSTSHSCVQSVGVTNSITTPNCACLGACPACPASPGCLPAPTPFGHPTPPVRTIILARDFSFRFHAFTVHVQVELDIYICIIIGWQYGIRKRALLWVFYSLLFIFAAIRSPLRQRFHATGHSRSRSVSPWDLIVFCHTGYPFWGVSCSKLKLTDALVMNMICAVRISLPLLLGGSLGWNRFSMGT